MTIVTIVAVTAIAIGGFRLVWDLATPGRLDIPVPKDVEVQANGLPVGYEFAAALSGQGDKLMCGPISWELVGEVPPGGRTAVMEAVELLSTLTGLTVQPADQVGIAAVPFTLEFVSASELARAAAGYGGGNEAIGLAITMHSSVGITSSQILLSEPFFSAALASNEDQAVLVVLHELGHALGLGHSADPSSVMYPYLSAQGRITDADVVAFKAVTPSC
jgi:hypothetical protein